MKTIKTTHPLVIATNKTIPGRDNHPPSFHLAPQFPADCQILHSKFPLLPAGKTRLPAAKKLTSGRANPLLLIAGHLAFPQASFLPLTPPSQIAQFAYPFLPGQSFIPPPFVFEKPSPPSRHRDRRIALESQKTSFVRPCFPHMILSASDQEAMNILRRHFPCVDNTLTKAETP